ncbi:MAG: hypothetical protein HC892_09820 [Saprospiraceae bacterium]|nr:hypothetical protein [Saprospiraceae bacterium]
MLTVSRADGNHAEGKKLSNLSVSPDDSYGSTLFDIYFPLFFPSAKKSILVVIKK